MKLHYLIALLFLSAVLSPACHKKKKIKPAGFIERSIELQNQVGKITIQLPARLDKYNSWKDELDNGYARAYYRFLDDNYKFANDKLEDALSNELDSIYQFTIFQNIVSDKIYRPFPCFDRCDSTDVSERWRCSYHNQTNYLRSEIKNVNNRPFSVYAGISYGNKMTRFVIAKTCLNNRQLIFYAECRGIDTLGFIDTIYKSMNSIKIIEYN